MVPSLPLLLCESSVSVKENPDRKKKFPSSIKAGNNSEKLKYEIRQLLYSLYRSKKITKQL